MRAVADVFSHEPMVIDAEQVGADAGNVVVVQVQLPEALWLVAVYDRPGPPPPPEQWHASPPPALFTVHVCASVPLAWPQVVEYAEQEAMPA